MSFQAVPPQADLQASIPAGRMAVTIRSYVKPTPAFGPGSVAYVQQMAEELEILESGTKDDGTLSSAASAPRRTEPTYAGAGSYY